MGLAMSVLAMHARTAVATERMTQFDTDGEWVGVDNRCTGCISHVRSDFVSDLTPSNRSVKGFGGTRTTNVNVGTIRWKWERSNPLATDKSYLDVAGYSDNVL
jgi:hypothetical protein